MTYQYKHKTPSYDDIKFMLCLLKHEYCGIIEMSNILSCDRKTVYNRFNKLLAGEFIGYTSVRAKKELYVTKKGVAFLKLIGDVI